MARRTAVHRAVRAVVERDDALAQKVREGEGAINTMEMEIDELATKLLVLQQPVARDLRFLTSVLKINTDLERMGDLANNLASRAQSLSKLPPLRLDIDIPHMSSLVESMLLKSLDAFLRADADLAQEVLMSDDEVDRIRGEAYGEIVAHMQTNPSDVRAGVEMIFVVRNLERIGDHATNMAEDVIYMAKGVDVRHHAKTSV